VFIGNSRILILSDVSPVHSPTYFSEIHFNLLALEFYI